MNTTRVNLGNGLFLGAALILLVLSMAAPHVAEAMTLTTNGPGGCISLTGLVKQQCLDCTTSGGTFTFTDNGGSTTTSKCEAGVETTSCFYGDISGCQLCIKFLGCGPDTPLSSGTSSRTAVMNAFIKKFPLTAIPAHRLPPRLRTLRAKQIRINNQRKASPRHKVGTVQPRTTQKQGQTQKQESAITKPTRPGVPMPTEPIRPGKPMAK